MKRPTRTPMTRSQMMGALKAMRPVRRKTPLVKPPAMSTPGRGMKPLVRPMAPGVRKATTRIPRTKKRRI